MPAIPRISETEWEIMKVVWARGSTTAAEIIEALSSADPSWHPRTAKTLINRLVNKKALGFKTIGRSYLYFARLKEVDCISAETESFLGRVFGGTLQPMLAHFLSRRKLSPAEIEELKRLLEQKD